MNKVKIWILCISAAFLILTGTAVAETDWGKTGVSDTGRVRKVVQLTDNVYDDFVSTPEVAYDPTYLPNPWSSDSRWIVYSAEIVGSSHSASEICKIKPDGSGFQRLTNNSAGDSCAQFTPDGNKIVFGRSVSYSGESIFVMDSDGNNQTDLTATHSGTNAEMYPLVSPDGTKIAYYSNSAIWVMGIDGSGETQVSGMGVAVNNSNSFCWSPDSSKIAYPGYYDTSITYKIYTVDPDGSNNTRIGSDTASLIEKFPAWSPDGSKIAYMAESGTTDYLMQMDTNGSNKEILVQEVSNTGEWGYINPQISWSPDSRWIVYTKDQRSLPYYSSIFIVNRYTGKEVQLTNGYQDWVPIWSPDGRNIIFCDDKSGSSRDNSLPDNLDGDLLLLKLIPRSISAVNSLILY